MLARQAGQASRRLGVHAPVVASKGWGARSYYNLPSLPSLPRARSQPRMRLCLAISKRGIITIRVPPMAESIEEGTLKQWTKQVGEHVRWDEELVSIETDKVDIAVNAPESGCLTELLVSEDATVKVGQAIAYFEPGEAPAAGSQKDDSPTAKADSKPAPEKAEQPTPAPPKDAAPAQSREPAEKSPGKPAKDSAKEPSASTTAGSSVGSREERHVKMNRMRLRIAERLKQSQNTAASLTTFNEVDMTSLVEFRGLYKEDILKRKNVKLGFMGAFARACVLAMRDIPVVNAAINESGDTIIYHDYIDLSVAVATEKGLVTPVIRNVEAMDVLRIESAIAEVGKKARDNKLTIEDMAGGTFTISNGGVYGSLMGTPILNLPQSAVLGLHAIKDRAVAVKGKVEVRPMMNLALTYDHRLLDGREAVQFLVKVKEYIEDPRRMIL